MDMKINNKKMSSLRFLEHIEPLAFHDLKSLEVLECQNNKHLTSIDPFAFYDNLEKQTRFRLLFIN